MQIENYGDYIIPVIVICFIGYHVIMGIRDGALKKVLSLLSVVGAVILTKILSPTIVEIIIGKVNSMVNNITEYELAIHLICNIVLFFVLLFILNLFVKAIKKINKIPIIGGINRIFGAFVGGFEGLLYVWVIFKLLDLFKSIPPFDIIVRLIQKNEILFSIFKFNILNLIFK